MKLYRPNFITESDYPWLTKLVNVYSALDGKSVKSVEERMTDDDVPATCRTKFIRAKNYLNRRLTAPASPVASRQVRLQFFGDVFANSAPPNFTKLLAAYETVAVKVGLTTAQEARALLLADIDDEQIITIPSEAIDIGILANDINLSFAKSLLQRADCLDISIVGHCRRIIQLAKLKGLICVTQKQGSGYLMQVSGPLSLNCKTRIYGHAFASLASVLPWCDRYELAARCHHDDKIIHLRLQSGDPIRPSQTPKQCDSKIEEQVVRALLRLFPDWDAIREPQEKTSFMEPC